MDNEGKIFISELKKYDQVELFLWTQVISIHPNNQLYQYRFELLCAIILSLPPDKFENKKLSRDNFIKIIDLFNQEYGNDFYMFEDWKPHSVLKSIPLIINKNKYYFFAGSWENSYEQYQKYIRYFFNKSISIKVSEINSKIIESLSFQTELLTFIFENDELKIKTENIHIPSMDFFNEIKNKFSSAKDKNCLNVDDFNSSIDNLKENIMNFRLYNKAKIKLNDRYYWIFPQEHLVYMYNLLNNELNKELLTELNEILKKDIQIKSAEFFSKKEFEINVFNKDKKSLLQNIDFCAIVDYNKLFLIKCTEISKEKKITLSVENATKQIQQIEKRIKEEGKYLLVDKKLIPLSELNIDIIKIIVHENTQGEYYCEIPEISNKHLVVSYTDYLALLDTFESSIDFFRFIRDDTELRHKIHTADFLDRVPYYIKNNLSFPIASEQIDFLQILPHGWLDYYYNKLYEDYVINRKEKLERLYGKNFNKIKKVSDEVYEFIDTFSYSGGVLIENSFIKDIIIQFPLDIQNLSSETIKSFSSFLSPLIYTYVKKMNEKLKLILKDVNKKYDKYIISLYPSESIKKNGKFKFLEGCLSNISEEIPVFFKTGIISGNILKTCVIYDYNHFPKLFKSPENEGERRVMKLFLEDLFLFLKIPDSEKVVASLIDEFIPKAKKGFSYDIIPVHNKKLRDYSDPIFNINSDIMKVNRELTQFIKSQGVNPGVYENEEANRINCLIFDYLKNKIEQHIAKLGPDNLFFIYNQIELSEGARTRHDLRMEMDSKKYVEYDLIDNDLKKTNEISTISVSSKLILQYFLKNNPNGNKRLTLTDWTYLIALVVVHQDCSLIYDYIKHNIQENKIKITDLYELNDIKGKHSFDIQKFLEEESQKKMDSKKEFDLKQIFKENIDSINETFQKQLGFSFDDILNLLMILGKSNFKSNYEPLTLIEVEKLSKYITKIDKKLSNVKINKIISFLSLNQDSQKDMKLMPLTLSSYLKRTTLCPLVAIDNKVLYGNELCIRSALFWANKILNGVLPYDDNKSDIEIRLQEYYKKIDDLLENEAIKEAKKTLGEENIVGNLKKYKAIGIDKNGEIEGGEIDILGVNKTKKIVFVLDAKHTIKDLTPYGNFREFNKFFLDKKSYLSKLNKKVEFVKKYISEILNYFKIADKSNWTIKKGFVVNTHIPSIHYCGKDVELILLDELIEYLTKD